MRLKLFNEMAWDLALVGSRKTHIQNFVGDFGTYFLPEIVRDNPLPVAYPGFFFGGGSTNSIEDRGKRGRGSGGGSPLVRGSGGSCNLVQEISFHIVKFS